MHSTLMAVAPVASGIIAAFAILVVIEYFMTRQVFGEFLKEKQLDMFFEKNYIFYQTGPLGATRDLIYSVPEKNLPFMSTHPFPNFWSRWYIYDYGVVPRWSKWNNRLDALLEELAPKIVPLSEL